MFDGRVNEEDNIFTEDIEEVFAEWIGLTDEEQRKELEEGLFAVLTLAENKHNADYWRTLYYTLSKLAEVLSWNLEDVLNFEIITRKRWGY